MTFDSIFLFGAELKLNSDSTFVKNQKTQDSGLTQLLLQKYLLHYFLENTFWKSKHEKFGLDKKF